MKLKQPTFLIPLGGLVLVLGMGCSDALPEAEKGEQGGARRRVTGPGIGS